LSSLRRLLRQEASMRRESNGCLSCTLSVGISRRSNAVSSTFRTALAQQSATPIEFIEDSMETALFAESDSQTAFVEYLRTLLVEQPPDLIVSIGAPGMFFLQRHPDNLFPPVPLLFVAADKRRLSDFNRSGNATAVGINLDFPGLVENIVRLLPCTTNIQVVIGDSPFERF
jgi:hypothetical protein